MGGEVFMSRPKLQHCLNGCCYFVDGRLVTKPEYEAALQQHKAFETISVCYQVKPRCRDTQAIHSHVSGPYRGGHT
jgi:hypothetical protein